MRPIKLTVRELDLITESIDHAIYQCFQWINTGSLPFDYEVDDVSEKILQLSDLSEKIFDHVDTLMEDKEAKSELPSNVLPFDKEEK
tara:strand:+ start:418 stop:678 length:261 start_codon:yes stop_codon:yes gene_type:complete